MTFRRLYRIIALRCLMHLPMPKSLRLAFAKMGGVRVLGKDCYIGEGVIFDSLYPERITIGKHVHITMGCIFLTHTLDTSCPGIHWKEGTITIMDDVFIGANTIICNSVTIGKNAIVGAGSVVTKDIPENEIWAGNPARFIKHRSH